MTAPAKAGTRTFWFTMTYGCDRCGREWTFYLEEGLEGPRETEVDPPAEWLEARRRTPPEVRSQLPAKAPATNTGRLILPVPFVASGCPDCQGPPPWTTARGAGVLSHVKWHEDRILDPRITEPPEDAPRFLYPEDPLADQACGVPWRPWLEGDR